MLRKLQLIIMLVAFSMASFAQDWIEVSSDLTSGLGIGQISIGMNDATAIWAAAINPDGTTNDAFTHSTDGGLTWTSGTFNAGTGLSMIFAIDATICWAVFNTGADQGLYKTTDGGTTWAKKGDVYGASSFVNVIHFFNDNDGFAQGDPIDGYYELYTTTDGGESWTRVPQANIPAPTSGEYGITGNYSAVGNSIWWGTNQGRVYYSIDMGYTWEASLLPFGAANVVQPLFKNETVGIAFRSFLDMGIEPVLNVTTDGGATWSSLAVNGDMYARWFDYIPGTDGILLGSSSSVGFEGVSYSLDNGSSWMDFTVGVPVQAPEFIDNETGFAGTWSNGSSEGILIYNGSPIGAVNFGADVTVGQVPLTVQFFDSTIGSFLPTTWQWDFENDGIVDSYEQNPQWTFENFGFYTVKLIVSNGVDTSQLIKENLIEVNGGDYYGSAWHVSTNGDDQFGSGSAEYPFATILHGIEVSSDGDTVLVAPGNYNEQINFMGKNIMVASHYILNNDPAIIGQTIIDGEGSGTVVRFENHETAEAKIIGLTITGASNGAINIINSDPELSYLIISNNTSSATAGGVNAKNSAANISYCKFMENTATSGSAIYIWESDNAIIHHNEITNNTASNNGIIYINNCSPLLHHNLIANNVATVGAGGIRCNIASPVMINNTIVNNSGAFGGGVRCLDNSNPVLINNIIWGNTATSNGNQIMLDDNYSDPDFYYNNIEGGSGAFGRAAYVSFDGAYENCIDEDPFFADAANGDFTLTQDSPCIDSGDPTQAEDPDLTPCDMGYQYFNQDFVALFEADLTWGYPSFTANFTDLSTGNPTSWAWDLDGDGNTDSYDQNPSFTYNDFGKYSVSLTTSSASKTYTRFRTDYINAGFTPKSIITAIEDVPNDQGGKVFVNFTRSHYDTDTLQDWPAGYNVEMNTGYGWISIASVGAYGSDYYTAMAITPFDSSQYSNGLIDFRVIAIMQEGNFASATSQGYSVDNLAPAVPDNMDYELLTNEITMNWDNCSDRDFAYFAIYKSDVSGIFAETPFATTTQAAFADQLAEGEIAYYIVTATDFHGNESLPSDEIETVPAMRFELNEGWSGISSFIDPTDADIENMFADIESQLIILQNDNGMYWPGQNVNTFGNWNMGQGYKIKVAENVNMTISGSRIQNQNLSMGLSWNLMPVLSECPVNAADLFAGKDVSIVKEVAGWRVYWPEFGINTLQVLEPGKAYFALMDSEEEIEFPECIPSNSPLRGRTGNLLGLPRDIARFSEHFSDKNLLGLPRDIARFSKHFSDKNLTGLPTPISHNIALPISANSSSILAVGDIVGVFDAKANCYGLAEWNGANTALTTFGNDPMTVDKDGFDDGETMVFKLFRMEDESEITLEVAFNYSMPQTDAFAENGLSAINNLKAGNTGFENFGRVQQSQIVPNPAHDAFTLILDLDPKSEGTLELYNLKGQLMKQVEINAKTTKIEINDLPVGVYVANIIIDNQTMVKQLIKH